MNLPNSITMSRIFSVPVFIWMMSPLFPFRGHGEQELAASILFILASITDGVDGYLARRRKQITTMGMLLDPVADKLLISVRLHHLGRLQSAHRQTVDRRPRHRTRIPRQRTALHRHH